MSRVCKCGCGVEVEGRRHYANDKHASKHRKQRQRKRERHQAARAYLDGLDPAATTLEIECAVAQELRDIGRAVAEAHERFDLVALSSLRERRRHLQIRLNGESHGTKHSPGLYEQRRREQLDLALAPIHAKPRLARRLAAEIKTAEDRRRIASLMQRNVPVGSLLNLTKQPCPGWDRRKPWEAALDAIDRTILVAADELSQPRETGRRIYSGCRCRSCSSAAVSTQPNLKRFATGPWCVPSVFGRWRREGSSGRVKPDGRARRTGRGRRRGLPPLAARRGPMAPETQGIR